MTKVRHGNYELKDCDADLQNIPARTAKGVVAIWPLLFDQALDIIFDKVRICSNNQLDFNRKSLGRDFFATKTAPVSSTGIETTVATKVTGRAPVEWMMRTTGGHGSTATNWQLMIDLDDIPPGGMANGPDRPHIGYLLTGKGKQGSVRVDGHIFIEHVIATRNAPGEEETIAANIFKMPLSESV
jgi:hypothetical protein